MPGLGLPFPDWGGNFWTNIADFISNGSIPEWRFNDMVIRTLTSYFWLGQDADPLPPVVYVRPLMPPSQNWTSCTDSIHFSRRTRTLGYSMLQTFIVMYAKIVRKISSAISQHRESHFLRIAGAYLFISRRGLLSLVRLTFGT